MRRTELRALTGVRFYAALAVFLSHVTVIPGMEALGGKRLVFNAGVVGVSFFFVLSGFILTYNYGELFKSGISASGYKRFAWDRFTKIYPVYLATLLLVLPIALNSPNLPLDGRALPVHLLMLQCWMPFSAPTFFNYLNVPSWSISCEWFFYLLAPVAMFLALGRTRSWPLLALAAAYAAGLGWYLSQDQSAFTRLYFVSWFAPSRFGEFLAGVFVARLFMSTRVGALDWLAAAAQVVGVALIAAGAIYRSHAPWPLHGGLLYVPGSALTVFGLALGRGGLVGHLSRPWINRLGLASFSFYMVHAPILRAAKGAFLRLGWEIQSWLGFWATAAAMFIVAQAVALGLLLCYEAPLQARLRRAIRAW